MNIYENTPQYESKHFLLRKVRLTDAGDLLRCYSDPEAVGRMNADNCTNNFHFTTLSDMEACIRFWLDEVSKGYYLRFALVDKAEGRAFGTTEIFNKGDLGPLPQVGLLRLDLAARYETEDVLRELFSLTHEHFYGLLELQYMMTKAPRAAGVRRMAMEKLGYLPVKNPSVAPYEDYWFRWKKTPFEVAESIACCGLVCAFCHSAGSCTGCRESLSCRRLSEDGCFQYQCSGEKGFEGCWECPDGPCGRDMFSESHDLRNRVFVQLIREKGREWLAKRLLENQQFGIQYGWQKDYDGLDSPEAIRTLLETGNRRNRT